jgi:hypothetical protein
MPKYLEQSLTRPQSQHTGNELCEQHLPENSPIICRTLAPTFTKRVTSEGICGPTSCIAIDTNFCENLLSCSDTYTEETIQYVQKYMTFA